MVDNIIDLLEYADRQKELQRAAQLEVAVQEVRNQIVRGKQGELIVTLHTIFNAEREHGLLTELELIEVINIFSKQVENGLTIK